MQELFTLDAFISLLTLTILEIVLGIDNVIFVSILMGRLDKQQQLKARRVWMFRPARYTTVDAEFRGSSMMLQFHFDRDIPRVFPSW